jgi:hypothetical protein
MIAQFDPSSLAPLLAGPASAVAVLLLVGGAVYRLAIQLLLPMMGKAIDRHMNQIDELIKVQKAESKAITNTLASIDRRLARLEGLTDAGQFINPNPGALSPDRGV